ncbi:MULTISPECIES: hypothetical protein [Streptomyces]|uniref:hypothetical protein n=1 Tax=Streptomyces TaxID=1883 RepID=UPI0003C2DDCA|nr:MULTISPECIES: hypothetical protein [unclassified Streptomyces]ESP96517.1 Hypothetical protein B591_25628 [Streptomyces sp. GBA 94-10 4N24]ESQ02361.1 Hypothetical protein B590_25429 [Streptomyces sp. PVA_94-07]UZN62137.1 Hypothetical protein B591N_25628 [Streptomyces sp. GBA 94-10 4N24]
MGVAVCSLKWEAARTGSQRIVYDSDGYHLVRFPYEESEESYDPWGMHDPGKAYPDPESGLIVPSHDGWGTVSALVFWAPDSRPVEYRARFVRDPLGSSTGYDSTATTDSSPTGGNQFRTYMWQMFVRKDTPLGLKVTARAAGDVPVPAALTLAEFKLAVQTDVHVPE